MSAATRRIGILGGRFDPIHRGHLATAAAAQRRLQLDRVLMLPSRLSPHRKRPAGASGDDRLAMVALAAHDHPSFEPCDLELTGEAPSYTATTLHRLHERGHPRTSLFFIVGADAFADIADWHDYPRLLDAAHFVVVSRPGHPVAALPDALPALRPRLRPVTNDAGPGGGEATRRPCGVPDRRGHPRHLFHRHPHAPGERAASRGTGAGGGGRVHRPPAALRARTGGERLA